MQRASRYFLGIDAGATKTHALIADENGHVYGSGHSGPGNWEGVGLEGAYEAYAAAIAQALAAAELEITDLSAGGYALAGLDFPSDEGRLKPIIEQLGVPGPQVLVNDTYGALRAGTRDGVGVVIIAGTGTTVAGCNRQGERFRTFGEGQMLGDIGGAGDYVWLAVRAVAQAYTGRGEPTLLTKLLVEACDVDGPLALIEGLCRHQIERPRAKHAPLVFQAADQGDRVAQGIIRHVGCELGANAAAVARRLGMHGEAFDLVLAGGTFRSGSELLLGSIIASVRAIAPQAQLVQLQTAPVAGSTLLAMDATQAAVTPEVQQRLAAQVRSHLGADAMERE